MKFNARLEKRKLEVNLQSLYKAEHDNPGAGMKDIERMNRGIVVFHALSYHGAVCRSRTEKYLLGEQPTKRALIAENKL